MDKETNGARVAVTVGDVLRLGGDITEHADLREVGAESMDEKLLRYGVKMDTFMPSGDDNAG